MMNNTSCLLRAYYFFKTEMKIGMKVLSLLSLFLFSNMVNAQVYPVQATTQLTPPYSLYLADYVESGTERIALNVFVTDISRPSLDIRLKLKIIGQGITLETKAGYIPPAVSVQGGVPLRLISTDLADYFNPNNLTFDGMSQVQYEQRGKLPEGVYQFCFEVLEYNRGIKISNTSCATAWLVLNDPPIVNMPQQNKKIQAQSPQNVLLQWTPRHTGSPNSAFSTEYEIKMVEVWPETRNPNDAILTSPPILEETTRNSTFIYGPSETPLELGRRYAFRIRAKGISGVQEMDLFKNNGYSEVFSFVYGDACNLPTGIATESIGSSRFNLNWDAMFNHTAFKVRYREAGTTNWYENNVAIAAAQFNSLKPSTTYEYQVAATCGFFDGPYSDIARVTTADEPETAYSCGVPLTPFNLNPAELTGSLKPGDVIEAGDFDVKLVSVTGSNGVFSGEGVIEVPYLNKAKVKTSFTNITVNKELRMVNGFMNVTGAAVDIIPQVIMDNMDKLSETLDKIDSAITVLQESQPVQVDWKSVVPDTLITVPGEIISVTKNADGSVAVTDNKGVTRTLPAGTNYAVKDDSGNGYLVDKKGNIHKTTSDAVTKLANREYNLVLKFNKDARSKYGFDQNKFNPPADTESLTNGYKVPWKSVASGISDPVMAKLEGSGIDKNKIRFELGGAPVQASPIGSAQTTSVSITGKSDGSFEDLLALYSPADTSKEQVLGKVKIVSYNAIAKSLIIVPVNNITLPTALTDKLIEDSLNAIYGQAVAGWRVSVAKPIEVSLDAQFDDGESGMLTNYTNDMKKVIKAFGRLQDETYYLFLVKNPKSGDGLGYMPRGKQAGFIFTDKHGSEAELVRTMAHELGHGAFNLHHTFKEPNFPITKGTTDNLMDYPSGNKLYKYQWDKMRYPDIVVGLFEEDEEGEYGSRGVADLPDEFLNEDKQTFTFLTPFGDYITLPKRARNFGFLHGFTNQSEVLSNNYIVGSLTFFEVDQKFYSCLQSGLYSLVNAGGEIMPSYKDTLSVKQKPTNLIVAINTGDGLFASKYNSSLNLSPYGTTKLVSERQQDFNTSVFLEQNRKAKYRLGGVAEDGQYRVTEKENYLVGFHKDKPTILLVNKIAQIQNMYPVLFTKFTTHWENWKIAEEKKTTHYDPHSNPNINIEVYGSWDIKVGKDAKLLALWNEPKSDNEKLEFYRIFLNELSSYINVEIEEVKNFWATLSLSSDRFKLVDALSKLSDEDYKLLTSDQRIIALQILAHSSYPAYTISGPTEGYILKLFTSVEDDEQKHALLDALVKKKDIKNEKFLLPALCKDVVGVDNPEFSELIVTLVTWIQEREQKVSLENLLKLLLNPEPAKRRQIPFPGNFFAANSEYFNAEGNLTISSIIHQEGCFTIHNEVAATSYNSCDVTYSLTDLPPYEIISIKFMEDYAIGNQTFKKNSTLEVPAIFAYMLFNNENGERIAKGIKIGVNGLILVASAGAFSAAVVALEGGAELTGAWLFTKATVDAGVALTDLTLTFKEAELSTSIEGREILDDWNQFTHLYWNLRLGGDLAEIAAIKLNNLYKAVEGAISKGKLGTITVDAKMAEKLRSIYTTLEERSNIAITRDVESKIGQEVTSVAIQNTITKSWNLQIKRGFDKTFEWFKGLASRSKLVFRSSGPKEFQVFYKQAGVESEVAKILPEGDAVIIKANGDLGKTSNYTSSDIKEILYEEGAIADASNAIRNAQAGEMAVVCKGGKCDIVVPGCFVAGTLIKGEHGRVPIERIKAGQFVYTYDSLTHTNTLQKVKSTFTRGVGRLLRIIAGKDTIYTTPSHEFYANQLWVPASQLRKGASIFLATGMMLSIIDVQAIDTTVTTYNFEVEQNHNYFIGSEGILVHNGIGSCISKKYEDVLKQLDDVAKTNIGELTVETQNQLLKDISETPELLTALKNNPDITAAFLLHKDKISSEVSSKADEVLEAFEDLPVSVQKWIERSELFKELRIRWANGNKFGEDVIGKIYDDFREILGADYNVNEFYIFPEVPMNTAKGFSKRDAWLVKFDENDLPEIIIDIESKLTIYSPYTNRQMAYYNKALSNGKFSLEYNRTSIPNPYSKETRTLDTQMDFSNKIDVKNFYKVHGGSSGKLEDRKIIQLSLDESFMKKMRLYVEK